MCLKIGSATLRSGLGGEFFLQKRVFVKKLDKIARTSITEDSTLFVQLGEAQPIMRQFG